MTQRTLKWSATAKKDLESIGALEGKRVAAAMRRFAKNGLGNVKRLKGSSEFRIRVGNYRARFTSDATQVNVLRVFHRREAYR